MSVCPSTADVGGAAFPYPFSTKIIKPTRVWLWEQVVPALEVLSTLPFVFYRNCRCLACVKIILALLFHALMFSGRRGSPYIIFCVSSYQNSDAKPSKQEGFFATRELLLR